MKSFFCIALLAVVAISLAQVGAEEDHELENSGRELSTFRGKKIVTFCDHSCGSGYYCKSLSKKYCGYKKVCKKVHVKDCLYHKRYYYHGKALKKCVKYGYKWVTRCSNVYDCGYKICAKNAGFRKRTFHKKTFLKQRGGYGGYHG
ncbi:hypothetical protein BSKO_06708 [Bryopsis sp. KO-2023]|nr:hypothetical protein BSKO_06708 [Bryopsis sp. KO-2023]